MKKLTSITIAVVILLLLSPTTFAQKKIGVFVHGFNGSGEKWTVASKAPEFFKKSGAIDEAVVFNYKSEELNTKAGQQAMFQRFVAQMDRVGNRGTDEWVLISHSLGGIVSRVLYPNFRAYGFNVTSIVNIGGPVQGTKATDLNLNEIEYTFNRMEANFKRATDYEWPLLAFFLDVGNILNFMFIQVPTLGNNNSPSARALLNGIPEMIHTTRDSALGYASYVLESEANDRIGIKDDGRLGIKGDIIQDINSYNKNNYNLHPPNYVSVIGAEKDQAPIRMAGHIFSRDESNNEVSNLKQLDDFDIKYIKRNKDHWGNVAARWNLCAWISKDCRRSRDTANKKKGYWNIARNEVHSLGRTWSELINSYRIVNESYESYIPPCEDNNRPGGLYYLMLEPSPGDCSPNPNGEYVIVPFYVEVADKNDGVVNIHSVLWSRSDSFYNIENDPNNQYFPDKLVNGKGNDIGGFNHFELRHYFRPYDLPDGKGGFAFEKGDFNPSMEFVEIWIRDN